MAREEEHPIAAASRKQNSRAGRRANDQADVDRRAAVRKKIKDDKAKDKAKTKADKAKVRAEKAEKKAARRS